MSATQHSLFDDSAPEAVVLRPYQAEAVARIRQELAAHRSTLLVMATGTGKTTVFGEIAREWPGKVLMLAHREELIGQAKERLEDMTGEPVDIEQAEWHSGHKTRLVTASIQSMARRSRLDGFDPEHFGLVIVDEAHHAPADSYRRVLEYFRDAKALGVTATPDRGDKKALGKIFESVAYTYDIRRATNDGWLCPIIPERVHVLSVNLAAVRTTAGDLNQGDLDSIFATEENIEAVVKPCLERCEDRPTIVFTTGVATADRMAEVFGRYRAGCAKAVNGKTDKMVRREIMRGFQAREFQFLVNVGIATEGFDAPHTAAIVIARPTKSRALYAQMAGRGLRIADGKVDCKILDISGNSGRHSLVGPMDVLGGSDEAVKRAKKILETKPGKSAVEAIQQAEDEIEARRLAKEKRAALDAARRAGVGADVKYKITKFDPFSVLQIDEDLPEVASQFGAAPATMAQLDSLKKYRADAPANCTARQAGKMLDALSHRARNGLCTYRQAKELQKRGVDTSKLSFVRAASIMTALAQNGWKPLPVAKMIALLDGRIPGEDG